MTCPDPNTPDVVATFRDGLWRAELETCPFELDTPPIAAAELQFNGERVACVEMVNDQTVAVGWEAVVSGSARARTWTEWDCTGSASAWSPNAALVPIPEASLSASSCVVLMALAVALKWRKA